MRNTVLALALGCGAIAASPAALARDVPYSNYGAVMANYIVPDDDRDADYGIGGTAVVLGVPLAEHVNIEFSLWGNSLNRELTGGNDSQYGAGLDIVIPLIRGKFTPFLLAGAGGMLENLENSADRKTINPYINTGAGLLYAFTNQLSLRGEARYLFDFNNDSYPGEDVLGDVRFGLGLQYAFNPPPPPVVPVAAEPPPPADSDKDGVLDPADQCPETPDGVKVNAKGCPIDSDGDGVPDYLDKCPETPGNFKVDESGCIVNQVIILRGVNFEFDRDVLTAEAKTILDGVLPGLKSQPKMTVEIGGHTDSLGSDGYNKALSQRRADAVKAYLVSKGVDAGRMKAVGYGEAKPIADNKTDAGRAENRRVEFQVIDKPVSVKVKIE